MSDKSAIEWTEATWNPVTGCTKVSPGCDNCYAEKLSERFRGTEGHYFERGFDLQLRPDKLDLPLRWRRPRLIFVNSMSDLFHDQVPDEYIARVFAVMAKAEHHTFQVLTKRHGRMRSLLEGARINGFQDAMVEQFMRLTGRGGIEWPLPNVWLGVSVEDQKWADIRIPALLDTPAAVRFLSCEPLLGPIRLPLLDETDHCNCAGGTPESGYTHEHLCGTEPGPAWGNLHWVIVGGESGHGARPMHPDWARSLRDQCQAAGIAFHFKQWGEWTPDHTGQYSVTAKRDRYQIAYLGPNGERFTEVNPPDMSPAWACLCRKGKKAAGRELDGRTWDEMPKVVPA